MRALVQLRVVEAVEPLLELLNQDLDDDYTQGNIDEMGAGTWPRVQVRLGLNQESDFQPEDFVPAWVRQHRANSAAVQKNSAGASGLPLDLRAFRPEPLPVFG